MSNACSTEQKTGYSRQHKVQANTCISQNDSLIPQHVKISSIKTKQKTETSQVQ